jgi:PKD repeat protein
MTTLSFRTMLGILSLCLLIAPACAAAPAISLIPAEVQVGSGETVTVAVAIDALPQGLSGYEIAFGIDDPVVAGITAVEFPEWAQMATQSTLPADTLRIKVADLNNAVRAGAANVTLCTLSVRGGTEGLARLSLTDMAVDDDAGGRYAPVSEPALVVVGGGAGTAVTMSPNQTTLLPGQTTEIVIAIDRAPEGLSGYEITVASDDPDVAVVTGIAFPAWAGMNENGTVPAGSIDVKAADLNNAVRAGAADVTLCTLTLRGVAAGSAGIAITRKQIDDDSGGRYAPITRGCEVTVTAVAETRLNIDPSGVDIAPGDMAEVSIVMDTVPQGLSGYNITMEIPEPEVATITAISFPDWVEMETTSPLPGGSVWMKAVDLKDTIHPGDTNISLCTLILKGGEKGATTGMITRAKVDDDMGGRYAPITGTTRVLVGVERVKASFTADPVEGVAPLTVTFTDTSSGTPTNWTWNFGDNETSVKRHPVHSYTGTGVYTVNLTVACADDSNTLSWERCITVLDAMHVGLGDARAEKGQVAKAWLTVSNASAIGAGGFSLSYDPGVVMVDAVIPESKNVTSTIDNENGITQIRFADPSGLNGDVRICAVALNAIGEPGDVSPLNVTVTSLSNVRGADRSYATVPVTGRFQVLYPDSPNPYRYRDAVNGGLYKGIQSGNSLYIGETDLNLTRLGRVQQLVHYNTVSTGSVNATIAVPDCRAFDIASESGIVPGRYYAWGADGLLSGEPWVEITEPKVRLDVVGPAGGSVNGTTLTRNVLPVFSLENNLEGLYTSPAAAFMRVEITTPAGMTVTTFGGRDLTGIPINRSVIALPGIDLSSAAAGTYTARAVWPPSSDFAGRGYDSNPVSFTIIDRPISLVASTENLVRTHPFAVTVTGDTERRYILYITDAGLNREDEYPRIAPDQPGVQTGDDVPAPAGAAKFTSTRAYIVTDTDGNCTVQFVTSTATAARTFTLRVVDETTGQNADEVQVRIEQGQVTVSASGDGAAIIGDEITLSGVNSDNAETYLFLTGPGLHAAGVNIMNLTVPAVSDDASTFTGVSVKVDDTWEYRWDTSAILGGTLEEGTYTVYAVSQPKARPDLAGIPYAPAAIRFTSPVQPGKVSFSADVRSGVVPLVVHFTDTSEAKPTSWLWTFGDNATSTDHSPTHTYTAPGTYTVTLSINGGAETCTKTAYIKVTPLLYGDANENNVVNQADTLRVLKEVVGLVPKPAAGTEQFQKTDVHRNGAIDVGDALFIAHYNVGLLDVWFEPIEQ